MMGQGWWAWRAVVCAVGLLLASGRAEAGQGATAFFYGPLVPVEELRHYQRVVVEPAHLDARELQRLQGAGAEVLAYVSVGEVSRASSQHREVQRAWVLQENAAWKSDVLDPSHPGVQAFLLRQLEALWQRGYRGFFLDTLDSPLSAPGTPEQRAARSKALAGLVLQLRQRLPRARLWVNRGFELLPTLAPALDGVVAESLFATWDAATQRYGEVPAEGQAWLRARLEEVRTRYRLPVVVVDYVPPQERERARAVAARIAALGYTPWVGSAALDTLGVGLLENVPRRILVLYSSEDFSAPDETPVNLSLAFPLNHLGYALDYLDVAGTLPEASLVGRYAGVVTCFTASQVPRSEQWRAFLQRQLDEGVRVLIYGELGLQADAALLARLGLEQVPELVRPLTLEARPPLAGFEATPVLFESDLPSFLARDPAVEVHVAVRDAAGRRAAAVLTAPWGGLASSRYTLQGGVHGRQRWTVDPFALFQKALALPPLPAPDVTTENGRRLLTSHIDGDGFGIRAQMPGMAFAGAVVLERILERYRFPTTVSFIEAELSAEGVQAQDSESLEQVARRISRLPHVELASHTFSHPFAWEDVSATPPPAEGNHLPVAGYRLSAEREVEGSVRYINERLAPRGKAVRVFLWSGDAAPRVDVVARTRALGLTNVNGGFTRISPEFPSLTVVSPFSRPFEGAFGADVPIQVYAAIADDNVLTNDGTGPFYGFRDVIPILQLTEGPRRLKPLSLYYHFWSGGKLAALHALEEVHRWAAAQETLPVPLSDYARKVEEFERLVVLRTLDGRYRFGGMDRLRTVRLPEGSALPDLARSSGVAAVSELPQGRYVTFAEVEAPLLALGAKAVRGPRLAWANGRVRRWQPVAGGLALRLEGHVPLRFAVAGLKGSCRLETPSGAHKGVRRGGLVEFTLSRTDTADARVSCH